MAAPGRFGVFSLLACRPGLIMLFLSCIFWLPASDILNLDLLTRFYICRWNGLGFREFCMNFSILPRFTSLLHFINIIFLC